MFLKVNVPAHFLDMNIEETAVLEKKSITPLVEVLNGKFFWLFVGATTKM